MKTILVISSFLVLLFLCGCVTAPVPGSMAHRTGDEIVVAGQFVHTGTPVVLWMDPGGYDAYRVERRFSSFEESDWDASTVAVRELKKPNRYGVRREGLTTNQLEQVRGGGWDLSLLQEMVDQFVLHFDVSGLSRQCFKVLHDVRGLSVHFMLDLDGTIYQTLDLKERAWHATTSNGRSVGIEIANMGTVAVANSDAFDAWYAQDTNGKPVIKIPPQLEPSGIRTPDFVGRPARDRPVSGQIQGQELQQYDFTPEQYRALVRLTATLCKVFPRIKCDYPRDAAGELVRHKLPDDVLANYSGILGHYHVQSNKVDPGPAFQWDYLVSRARRLSRPAPVHGATKLMQGR